MGGDGHGGVFAWVYKVITIEDRLHRTNALKRSRTTTSAVIASVTRLPELPAHLLGGRKRPRGRAQAG